ncbi:hypothetical protein GOBAR_DD05514 [Gossypium barbadense]|nr:hypothetical protein GOBAR_DD05514 [Gossypium barbadense]
MVKTRNFVEEDSTLATKAVWDDELTLIFCELCVNEVNASNRPTTHLSSKGWENVITLFQAKTQKNYGKPQLKNKWDTLKKEWRLWKELLKESTGIGWCPSKKTVNATEEWWAAKIQQMFAGIVATGENAWAPSSGVLPSGIPVGNDAPNEGFGDSDEHSNENEGIPPDEVPSNPSHEIPNRRKHTLGAVHGKGKNQVQVMDEFNNMYNSFDMNYDTSELSEEAQRRIATIVTQVEHNNYHEEEEYVLSSVLVHHETYFTVQPCMDSNYTDTIKPIEGQFEEVLNHIRHDTRYWPHFKDCIGAIDGTHIKACISPSSQIPYIGRKGKYYLVDSGYPQMTDMLDQMMRIFENLRIYPTCQSLQASLTEVNRVLLIEKVTLKSRC